MRRCHSTAPDYWELSYWLHSASCLLGPVEEGPSTDKYSMLRLEAFKTICIMEFITWHCRHMGGRKILDGFFAKKAQSTRKGSKTKPGISNDGTNYYENLMVPNMYYYKNSIRILVLRILLESQTGPLYTVKVQFSWDCA